jgi:hypothetical protein
MSFPDPPPSVQDRLLAIRNTNGMPNLISSMWSEQALTQGNLAVSNPSIVHRRSEQSITASEDYYSLSPSSSSSTYQPRHINDPAYSEATIIRYSTPPSRLRTPAHSRDNLSQYTRVNQVDDGNPSGAALRGPGQRRQSLDSSSSRERHILAMPAPLNYRADGGIRRKPVPSTVLENPNSPTQAEASIIAERSHFGSPPTPGPHDESYVRFALDQLTRDEEVRGSRRYADADRGRNMNPLYPSNGLISHPGPSYDAPVRSNEGRRAAPVAAVAPLNARHRSKAEQILGEDPTLTDEPGSPQVPTRSPRRKSTPQYLGREPIATPNGPDVFLPCAADASRPLNFLPGILRPAQLSVFIILVALYLAALIFVAVWSLVNTGLWSYTGFGNGRYFIFNYLPTLLGTVLLLWLFQIQIAVTRISPFLALSSPTQKTRDEGADLPLYQTNFLMPTSLQHFRAGQTMLGVFTLVAWLQVFTLPLLASAFNVYYSGSPEQGDWRWIATQGVVWPAIALYAFLLMATIALLIHLLRLRETGMKWDPRSLADLMVLLERSNALAEDAELGAETARVGLWRTSHRPNDVFHAYGLAGREVRKYSLEDGRITEKSAQQQTDGVLTDDIEAQRPDTSISHEKEPLRESDDAMLPRRASSNSSLSVNSMIALPWYLRPVFTSLWAISAVVLLLAFLVVSYLPSTRVAAGFNPSIPAPVNRMGYSGTNFLYSFIPTVIGELCLLTWLSFDLAHRRLAPFFALLSNFEGETAEHSLLLSYHADLPFHAPLVAAANKHYRTAWIAIVTLLAATLPTLGGGVFWAQFFIPTQSVIISAHMPAFYALTVFFTIYALSHLLLLPISHAERRLAHSSSADHNPALTFADILSLVRHSRILDDVAFHSPASKIDLVTRLLSAPVGASLEGRGSRLGEAGASLVSVADSIRGFGDARQRALGGLGVMETPKYSMGKFTGRNGREYGGIGRVKP